MSAPTAPTLGVDLGGTHLRVGLVDASGGVLAARKVATPTSEADALVAAIADTAAAVRADAGAASVTAIGVGIAALVDVDGVARDAPNVPALVGVPLRSAVAAATGLAVTVDNDANVAALGELVHGSAQGARHALVITLGTGIGGGIVIDGRIYRGAHGFAAEIGHWQCDPTGPMCACGIRGHWEALASGTALGRLGRDAAARGEAPSVLEHARGSVDAVDGFAVSAALADAAPDAEALLDRFADQVAIGCAGLLAMFDPERIVISGGLVVLGDALLDRVRERVPAHLESAAHRPEIPIVAGVLGDDAGLIGAAVLARGSV